MAKAFSDGVGPGGLHSTEDIKILVLYVLKTADVPFSMKSIIECTAGAELANYFEVTAAVSSLENDGLISVENEMYSLTEKGEQTVSELYNTLNYFVLEEARRLTSKEVISARILQDNKVTITPENGGYTVKIIMLEQNKEIFTLSVFVGTLDEANNVKEHFYENPSDVYEANIHLLLGYNNSNEKNTIE